jgi:hypothetical protein
MEGPAVTERLRRTTDAFAGRGWDNRQMQPVSAPRYAGRRTMTRRSTSLERLSLDDRVQRIAAVLAMRRERAATRGARDRFRPPARSG